MIVERGRVPSERGVAGEVEEYTHLAQEILDQNETASPLQAGLSDTQIAGFQPRIVPLAPLKFGPNDEYQALLESRYDAANDSRLAVFTRRIGSLRTAVTAKMHRQDHQERRLDLLFAAFPNGAAAPPPHAAGTRRSRTVRAVSL